MCHLIVPLTFEGGEIFGKNSTSISPSVMLIKVPCGDEIVTANLSLNYLQKNSMKLRTTSPDDQ